MTTNHNSAPPARIVLAEDDRTLARLIAVALKQTGFPHVLKIAHDGDSAIAMLVEQRPDLFLLDLYMPGKDGFDVLRHIKQQEHLRGIPVVMFSSSSQPADVNRAYDLHVNAYVMKHTDFPELCRSLGSIMNFWLETAMIPR